MSIDEKAAAEARQLAALRDATLTMLLERAGGEITFTEAEFQVVQARHGGPARATVRLEVLREPGQPDRVRARLGNKPATTGSLPV